jgi:hypothetical protein
MKNFSCIIICFITEQQLKEQVSSPDRVEVYPFVRNVQKTGSRKKRQITIRVVKDPATEQFLAEQAKKSTQPSNLVPLYFSFDSFSFFLSFFLFL